MTDTDRPASLEGRWDLLYSRYPEVYEEWSRIPHVPDFVDAVAAHFGLAGQLVVDVGSGSGVSTRKLARHARAVVGVEIEAAMLAEARRPQPVEQTGTIHYVAGDAEHLPLADRSVNAAVAVTVAAADTAAVAAEMERVVRPGGLVLRGDVAPGWYGGELNPVITGQPRNESSPPDSRDAVLAGLGYQAWDVFMDQDYGTVERAVRTYGFIHSSRAIGYIRQHGVTTIRWKARARYKILPAA